MYEENRRNLLELNQCQPVIDYIQDSWTALRRSMNDILYSMIDPKLNANSTCPTIYLSAQQDAQAITNQLAACLPSEMAAHLQIKTLTDSDCSGQPEGLLYLPKPYIVPGGRFNEMYGWDSYFIILGLLLQEEIELAKGMVENLVYEVEYYGKLLCANRSYYLQRAQPPLLSRAVLAVYNHLQDKTWLARQVEALYRLHDFWQQSPHYIPAIGLSRYYELGEGPSPEVVQGEIDGSGLNHYQRVRQHYRTHSHSSYPLDDFFDPVACELKSLFYKGDRSLRESGFDLTSRFGLFGAQTSQFIPVCLNTLLYQFENDLQEIHMILNEPWAAASWHERARTRAQLINHYCWNDDLGYYFDFNFQSQQTNNYIFATTYYPLWAGLASPEQAKRLAINLEILECQGGLLTSAYATGQQWDAPFGWPPLHYFAVLGLYRYGYRDAAERLARKFIGLINQEFNQYEKIFEKYNVVQQSSVIGDTVRFGYDTNEVGYGWANGVYLLLRALLSPELFHAALKKLDIKTAFTDN